MSPSSLRAAPLLALIASAAFACSGAGVDSDADTDTAAASEASGGATSGSSGGGSTGGATATGTDSAGSDGDSDGDSDSGEPAGPHALGTIVLGESHPAAGGSTTPSVSVLFIPDADGGAVKTCAETVAGCQVARVPACEGGCESDEYCGWSDGCAPTCLALCDAVCADGEACYFPSPGTTGCKEIEAFDAGVLSFFGTPLPLTLFPPYDFIGDAGSPFAAGETATVKASGAASAGYDAFERDFVGTQFVQTNPGLDTISSAAVFGDSDVPVAWVPGSGDLTITAAITGADLKSGTITCSADDAAGSSAVPRAAIAAALDGAQLAGLTLSVTRRRRDLYTDLTTKGALLGEVVQPVGWLEIITSSTELHTFVGCPEGEEVCDGACVDTSSDPDHCGGCGESCGEAESCEAGVCEGSDVCGECIDDAKMGPCKPANDACLAEPKCAAFTACIAGCQTDACLDECIAAADQPTLDLYNDVGFCLCKIACTEACMCG
ncbi:MAG: hypothetical protein KC486_06965 [Myxococcales bacterium]|nr:hypothetical protein [Myxococcales bacterium]